MMFDGSGYRYQVLSNAMETVKLLVSSGYITISTNEEDVSQIDTQYG